jgi:hypothetical protein
MQTFFAKIFGGTFMDLKNGQPLGVASPFPKGGERVRLIPGHTRSNAAFLLALSYGATVILFSFPRGDATERTLK